MNVMKKLAVMLLTVSSLLLSASAFAATSDGRLGEGSTSRNEKTALVSADSNNNISKADMPCFRAGDTLKFNVSGLTLDNQLTLISYKLGSEAALGNEVIQYINQYTLDAASRDISYQIRNTTDGIYKVVINGNDGTDNLVFYYKVGNPKYSIIKSESTDMKGNGYTIQDNNDGTYSIAFLASITMGSENVSFADAGVDKVCFSFDDGTDTFSATQDLTGLDSAFNRDTIIGIETEGSVSFLYGVTMYNVPSDISITATPIGEKAATTEGGSN